MGEHAPFKFGVFQRHDVMPSVVGSGPTQWFGRWRLSRRPPCCGSAARHRLPAQQRSDVAGSTLCLAPEPAASQQGLRAQPFLSAEPPAPLRREFIGEALAGVALTGFGCLGLRGSRFDRFWPLAMGVLRCRLVGAAEGEIEQYTLCTCASMSSAVEGDL